MVRRSTRGKTDERSGDGGTTADRRAASATRCVVRAARRAEAPLYGRDALPARAAELSPLSVVRRGDLHRAADVGRDSRVPVPEAGRRHPVRHRRGHARHVGERHSAGRLHLLVSLVPARVRRLRRRVLEGADALSPVECPQPPQRAPSGLRVAVVVQRGLDRPLHPPGGDGRDQRCEDPVMANHDYETHEHDVIVIGAGGAGLRAAIEAAAQGVSVGLVCKSLLGKAHTVMAEGGIAAALGNVWPEDNWQVHFRDTMRGGKMLNNWRMAQLHAQEAPDRVLELERWGALFDRTKDGRILQRDFGGHRYARLAHVGDRTGLEMIRTLQYHGIHQGIDVYMECKVERLLKDGDHVCGAFGYWRDTGKFVLFKAKAVVLATGGIGKAWKITSNSWEYTGDGQSLAFWAGADLIDMEFVQFHPTHMVWPPSVAGLLVTEGVRGDGGTLKNKDGERFMFNYIPEYYKGETADNIEEAERWYTDKKNNRRTPDLLPRDMVARAIRAEVKAGRGSPHGGVFLDICTRRPADYIRRRLPSMYHQFKELAGVDITKEPMEVGPTCHYVMGGVRVDADSTAAPGPGLFAAGEVAGGMHGSNRLGGNSLSDLLVFGRRAGLHAALYAKDFGGPLTVDAGQVEAVAREVLEPFSRAGGESPYAIQADLQETMRSRGGPTRGEFKDYAVEAEEGMVVLDVIHRLQATQATDLAVRWNCKAGKCGSCSAEIDGQPRLMCMTRMDLFAEGAPITVAPIRAFPLILDLVTEVGFNFEKAKTIPPLRLKPPDPDGTHRMMPPA